MQFDERAENRVDQLTRDLRSLAAKKVRWSKYSFPAIFQGLNQGKSNVIG